MSCIVHGFSIVNQLLPQVTNLKDPQDYQERNTPIRRPHPLHPLVPAMSTHHYTHRITKDFRHYMSCSLHDFGRGICELPQVKSLQSYQVSNNQQILHPLLVVMSTQPYTKHNIKVLPH